MQAKKMQTMDGNKAAAYISYAFTDVAAIYPITPSSPMAEYIDEWASHGQKNLFGQTVHVAEMQSEAGAAGAMHGSLSAGALTTTYTASQGLLLMIPNMYKMAGELLPGVFHVTARTLAAHTLSIFGDHSDVMACAQTGFAMLCSNSVQEVMDLAAVAHLAAIKGRVPFLHFFDGFRTSHEQQKIEVLDYADLDQLLDHEAVQAFRDRALNPEHPCVRGTNQNSDIFFQAKEAAQPYYDAIPALVESYMAEISKLTGRHYAPFDYYGAPDAEQIVVAMGSICDVAEQAVDYLNAQGQKTGLLKVRLYRPFSVEHMLKVLPKTVKRIAVLDRVKAAGAIGEPLYLDILGAFYGQKNAPLVVGGRYGLASKDTIPGDIIGVFANLAQETPKNHFTVGIVDDVSNSSLARVATEDLLPAGTIQCKFWGFGSDGTVGANKQAVDIIGSNTDLYAQAYFAYDSKKSGGLTVSHLRFGEKEIKAPYLISNADFISCSNESYVQMYDLLAGIKENGTFLLNCVWDDAALEKELPASLKRQIAEKKIQFYTINAVDIARELGLGNRTNMVMQAAFFKLAKVIPEDVAISALKNAVNKAYGKKGQKVVDMNCQAVDAGFGDALHQVAVPAAWANAVAQAEEKDEPAFVKEILRPMLKQEGDSLPVSAFVGREDGTFPVSGSKWEKRGAASFVPEWIPENCIQCNQCSLVCPHACIRPYLLDEKQQKDAPAGFVTKQAVGGALKDFAFRMQISPLDCQGCGVCVNICPAKEKALVMRDFESQKEAQAQNWEYAQTLPERDDLLPATNVKNSQFKKPLLEFSGACAGCGETPYAKLVTQLFGDRMMIANATGCSSIWGAAVPSMPYTTNAKGQGPAWSNSLFEDNAEFGYGMTLADAQIRDGLKQTMQEAIADGSFSGDLQEAAQAWIDGKDQAEASKAATARLLPLLEQNHSAAAQAILVKKDYLVKKSFWCFGGDGWAYDIGYGGLDHVLASGQDINILVFDTEVYSNTGGQSSKSTPTAAVAKFAASGKKTKKKDLGMMAMSYGYVYVAQIAMGADQAQALKAIREAEAYPGPSLIIAYSTCINHGVKEGMNTSQARMKKAVDCGYWHLYRYNPELKKEGKNPFVLDSKEPKGDFQAFLAGEVRYASLLKADPERAKALFAKTEEDAKERYQTYVKKAQE